MNLQKLISSSKDTSGDFIDMDVNAEWDKFQKKVGHTPEKRKIKPTLYSGLYPYAVAASIIGIGVLFYFLMSDTKKKVIPEATQEPTVLVKHQQLPDGSSLDLSSNAIVEFNNFNASTLRQVIFKAGLVKFSVVRDSLVPFVVQVDHLEVKVVGTVFTIDKSDSAITVHTLEGLVSVTSRESDTAESILISKGEYYTFYTVDQASYINVKETNTDFFIKTEKISRKQFAIEPGPGKKIETGIRTYYLEHIIQFLQKKHHGKLKLARRTKFDKKAKIKVNLNEELNLVVQAICNQTNLKARPGKCPDCIELYIEKKK